MLEGMYSSIVCCTTSTATVIPADTRSLYPRYRLGSRHARRLYVISIWRRITQRMTPWTSVNKRPCSIPIWSSGQPSRTCCAAAPFRLAGNNRRSWCQKSFTVCCTARGEEPRVMISVAYSNQRLVGSHSRAVGAAHSPDPSNAESGYQNGHIQKKQWECTYVPGLIAARLLSCPKGAPIHTAVLTVLCLQPLVGLLKMTVPQEASTGTQGRRML